MFKKAVLTLTISLIFILNNAYCQDIDNEKIRNNIDVYYSMGLNGFNVFNEIASPSYTSFLFETGVEYNFYLNSNFDFGFGGLFGFKLKGKSTFDGQVTYYPTNFRFIDMANSRGNRIYIGVPLFFTYKFKKLPVEFKTAIELKYWSPSGDYVDDLGFFAEVGIRGGLLYDLGSNNALSIRYFHGLNPFLNIEAVNSVANPDKPLKYFTHSLLIGFEFGLFKLNEN